MTMFRFLSSFSALGLISTTAVASQSLDVNHENLQSYDIAMAACANSGSAGSYYGNIASGTATLLMKDGSKIIVDFNTGWSGGEDSSTAAACADARVAFYSDTQVKWVIDALDNIASNHISVAEGTVCQTESLRIFDTINLKAVQVSELEVDHNLVACP